MDQNTQRTPVQDDTSWALNAGVKASELKTVAQYAQQQFNQGQFREALHLFYLLARIDSTEARYWMDLGRCYQQFKEHEQALFCFSQAQQRQEYNPYPAYYATLSLKALGNMSDAKTTQDAALRLCAHNPLYASLRQVIRKTEVSL